MNNNQNPLTPEFWAQAEQTVWEAKDVDDMFNNGALEDNNLFYANGVGFGFATVFDETGSRPLLISQMSTIVDCECGECETDNLVIQFCFPIEMGFQIIEMIQNTLYHYQKQYGRLERIEFYGDAD